MGASCDEWSRASSNESQRRYGASLSTEVGIQKGQERCAERGCDRRVMRCEPAGRHRRRARGRGEGAALRELRKRLRSDPRLHWPSLCRLGPGDLWLPPRRAFLHPRSGLRNGRSKKRTRLDTGRAERALHRVWAQPGGADGRARSVPARARPSDLRSGASTRARSRTRPGRRSHRPRPALRRRALRSSPSTSARISSSWRCRSRMCSPTSWTQKREKPDHPSQSTAQRFLTSLVQASDQPSPTRHRASKGSPRSLSRITWAGAGWGASRRIRFPRECAPHRFGTPQPALRYHALWSSVHSSLFSRHPGAGSAENNAGWKTGIREESGRVRALPRRARRSRHTRVGRRGGRTLAGRR